MQIIFATKSSPENYTVKNSHTQVRPPDSCPSCQSVHGLKAHGYYRRYTTDKLGKPISISVRRFKCRRCGLTVSCLPSFSHPYRFVNCGTIARSFNGNNECDDVRRNSSLLKRYWNRFERWSGKLRHSIGAPVDTKCGDDAHSLWRILIIDPEDFAALTCRLVRVWSTTCLGQYRCHQLPEICKIPR